MQRTPFIRLFLIFTVFSLLCAGCSARSTGEMDTLPFPQSADRESAAAPEGTDTPEEDSAPGAGNASTPLPAQVREDLQSMLSGSSLLTVAPDGRESRTPFPGKGYSDGQISADGRYLLCRRDSGGAGEARWSDHSLIDLQTMEQWDCDATQWGYQSHILLPNNTIGFADGTLIGGQEDTRPSIQLYDLRYQPVEVDWRFDTGRTLSGPEAYGYGAYPENSPTGIGYSLAGGYYVVTYAQDLAHSAPAGELDFENFPYGRSRLGVALLDGSGALLRQDVLPERYAAPFSGNILTLVSNNPVAIADGRIFLQGMNAEGNIVPLLLQPEDWSVTELPVGGGEFYPSPEGTKAFATRYWRVEEGPDNLLLHFEAGDVTYAELPDQWQAEGYDEPFHMGGQAAVGDGRVYVTASCALDDSTYRHGVFRWDEGGDMTLVRMLPDLWMTTLLGVDDAGNLLILLHGIGETDNIDVMDSYQERRQSILDILQDA